MAAPNPIFDFNFKQQNNIKGMKNWNIEEKIDINSIHLSTDKNLAEARKIIEWFNKMPPMTAKGNIDFFEFPRHY